MVFEVVVIADLAEGMTDLPGRMPKPGRIPVPDIGGLVALKTAAVAALHNQPVVIAIYQFV